MNKTEKEIGETGKNYNTTRYFKKIKIKIGNLKLIKRFFIKIR